MVSVSDELFRVFITESLASLPKEHIEKLENVALLIADDPSPEQREKLVLRDDETLFGLYEGVPLNRRQGRTQLFPDRITLFKGPLCRSVVSLPELKEQIRHTLWHEIAHYYGLNHAQIHELEE
jgi:predicted Zn-dependent protease with MMP-like domain